MEGKLKSGAIDDALLINIFVHHHQHLIMDAPKHQKRSNVFQYIFFFLSSGEISLSLLEINSMDFFLYLLTFTNSNWYLNFCFIHRVLYDCMVNVIITPCRCNIVRNMYCRLCAVYIQILWFSSCFFFPCCWASP